MLPPKVSASRRRKFGDDVVQPDQGFPFVGQLRQGEHLYFGQIVCRKIPPLLFGKFPHPADLPQSRPVSVNSAAAATASTPLSNRYSGADTFSTTA